MSLAPVGSTSAGVPKIFNKKLKKIMFRVCKQWHVVYNVQCLHSSDVYSFVIIRHKDELVGKMGCGQVLA